MRHGPLAALLVSLGTALAACQATGGSEFSAGCDARGLKAGSAEHAACVDRARRDWEIEFVAGKPRGGGM